MLLKVLPRALCHTLQSCPVESVAENCTQAAHQVNVNDLDGNATYEVSCLESVTPADPKKLLINGSIDFTGFPWLKYQTDLITGRREYAMRIQYTERKKWLTYLQFRRRNSDLTIQNSFNAKEKVLTIQTSDQLRLHLETKLNSDWTWRSRIEFHWLRMNDQLESGMLMSQDLLFKSQESRFSGNIRFAIFDISNYDVRIYDFENDLLYQYNLSAYNGRGIRAYINLRYRPVSRITLESKLSNSYFFDVDQNGSANDLINSPNKTEIKFQIQFHF